MTKALQRDIASLARRIEDIVPSETTHVQYTLAAEQLQRAAMDDIKSVTNEIQQLLDRIDREIPLLQLAITASGESLSTSLPSTISPSRLLQASTLLTVGDIQFGRDPTVAVQIGPTFSLSLYMLFQGHAPKNVTQGYGQKDTSPACSATAYGLGPNDRKPIWKEVVHKARVRVLRIKQSSLQANGDGHSKQYEYQLDIIEDLDDGRAHCEQAAPGGQGPVDFPTIKETLPIDEISKLFYADTGRILNLGSADLCDNNPILLLKRDVRQPRMKGGLDGVEAGFQAFNQQDADDQADVDRQLRMETGIVTSCTRETGSSLLRQGSHLDPEWIAFEIYEEDSVSDLESIGESEVATDAETPDESCLRPHRRSGDTPPMSLNDLSLNTSGTTPSLKNATVDSPLPQDSTTASSPLGAIATSLSLLEMLIRLAGLQEFQQTSHLSIPDHILTFFLEETSSTGLVGESQWRVRREARGKMGFDPYTDKDSK